MDTDKSCIHNTSLIYKMNLYYFYYNIVNSKQPLAIRCNLDLPLRVNRDRNVILSVNTLIAQDIRKDKKKDNTLILSIFYLAGTLQMCYTLGVRKKGVKT